MQKLKQVLDSSIYYPFNSMRRYYSVRLGFVGPSQILRLILSMNSTNKICYVLHI
jgi:hypothetical protein